MFHFYPMKTRPVYYDSIKLQKSNLSLAYEAFLDLTNYKMFYLLSFSPVTVLNETTKSTSIIAIKDFFYRTFLGFQERSGKL